MTEQTTVRMAIKISGTRDGADWPNPGQTLDVSPAEAADLIAGGYARPAASDETAVADTSGIETATPQGKPSIKAQAAAEAAAKAAAEAEAKEAAENAAAETAAKEAEAKAAADAEAKAAAKK